MITVQRLFFTSLIFFLVGCGSNYAPGNQNSEDSNSVQIASDSATQPVSGNNIFRLLTAVRSNGTMKQIMAIACERELGFQREMTTARVANAREIAIPIETTVYDPVVNIKKYHQQKSERSSENGVIFNPEVTYIPYDAQETLPGPHYAKGYCIGTEYIIE